MKRAPLSLLACALVQAIVPVAAQTTFDPYTFATLAGVAPGPTDGIGGIARFFHPEGIAVDGAGSIYVADTYNHTIRKITSDGVVTTFAGRSGSWGSVNGATGAARFYRPDGIAVDSTGNIYVSDSHSHTIRKVSPDGAVNTLAGKAYTSGSADGMGDTARFFFPGGLAVDASGNVYVADTSNNTIRKITPAGFVSTFAGLAGSIGGEDGVGSVARFFAPTDVTIDNAGSIYVADSGNHTIRKITPAGSVVTFAGSPGSSGGADGTGSASRFSFPEGLTADGAGNIYVADTLNQTVRKITPAGVVTTIAGSPDKQGSADGQGNGARFFHPGAIGVDNAGNVFVADTENHTIRKITPSGLVSTFAGTASPGSGDGAGVNAHFYEPSGAAFDISGNLYVTDRSNQTIRRITPAGDVSTFAGLAGSLGGDDGNGSAARFTQPSAIAIDGNGNFYVSASHSIRKITPAGVVSTFAGMWGGVGGSVDGTGDMARFYQPWGVATDSAGNVYVADTYNYTIRKITPAAVVSTFAGLAGSAGSADGPGNAARFYLPFGIAVDVSGNVYVADFGNSAIRKITPSGMVSTLAGLAGSSGSADGIGSAARFYGPQGIAVSPTGNLYVAENLNGTIRKITPAGVVSTVAGRADFYSSGSTDGPGSIARFNSPEGIAIDASGAICVADSGNNTLRIGHPSQAPPNDMFASALTITGASGSVDGNNVAATTETGEPQHAGYAGGHSVWMTWTAPQTGLFSFQLGTSSFSTLLAIYTGSQLNGLTAVASGSFGQAAVFRAIAGNTYYLAVDGYEGGTGSFTLSWSLIMGPANDDFANAQPLSGTSGSAGGNINLATVEPGEPKHAGASGYHSIWYRWTAPQNGLFFFDDTGSSYGTVLAIYNGSAVNALTLVGENGDYSGTSHVAFQATAGVTYQIALDAYDSYFSGPTLLNWRLAAPPANNNFADAQEINGSAGAVAGSTVDATKETGEPVHAFDLGGASIWYKWTAPANCRVSFTATGSSANFYPLLGIYTGQSVNSLRGLARASVLAHTEFNALAGVVYYIAIDGLWGYTTTNLVLSWQTLPEPQRTYEPYSFTNLAGIAPGKTDGAGSQVRLNRPNAVALDNSGNLYIADTRNHAIRKMTPAGVVTTFAGSPGWSGSADGVGPAARFNFPLGIAVGSDDVVYVADSSNHTIRKISPSGVVTTLAGAAGFFGSYDGTGTNALFDLPNGIAVAGDGVVYVSCSYDRTIRKIAPAGMVSTIAGLAGSDGYSDGTGSEARFAYPAGLTLDNAGNLYVADQDNYTVRKITPAGVVSTYAGMIGNYGSDDGNFDQATFSTVSDIAIDGADNLYVADQGTNLIRKITPTRTVSTVAGTSGIVGDTDGVGSAARFFAPGGIAATPSGTLYVADTSNSTIRRISGAGSVTTIAGLSSPGSSDGAATGARLNGSRGLAVDASGNTYVADTENHTIRKITPEGLTSTLAGLPGVFGTIDGSGSAARFRSPRGLVADSSGNLYVADTSNNMIRKITSAGLVSTLAGRPTRGGADGTGTLAQFYSPNAITIDAVGNLYVADSSNHTIRKITQAGVVTTLAGSAGASGATDGTGSAARFAFPRGIAIGQGGNLLVADTANHTVRQVTPDGRVTTIAGTAQLYGNSDGVGANALFNFPTSVAGDASGNFFVADRSNQLIRKINSSGVVSTIAGAVEQNGSQEGIGDVARFDGASGVAVGLNGKLYLADTTNNAIRLGRRVPLSSLEISASARDHRVLIGAVQPNAEVKIMATENLNAPFTLLATIAADAYGLYEYDDVAGASLPKRFYRAIVPASSARAGARKK